MVLGIRSRGFSVEPGLLWGGAPFSTAVSSKMMSEILILEIELNESKSVKCIIIFQGKVNCRCQNVYFKKVYQH